MILHMYLNMTHELCNSMRDFLWGAGKASLAHRWSIYISTNLCGHGDWKISSRSFCKLESALRPSSRFVAWPTRILLQLKTLDVLNCFEVMKMRLKCKWFIAESLVRFRSAAKYSRRCTAAAGGTPFLFHTEVSSGQDKDDEKNFCFGIQFLISMRSVISSDSRCFRWLTATVDLKGGLQLGKGAWVVYCMLQCSGAVSTVCIIQ